MRLTRGKIDISAAIVITLCAMFVLNAGAQDKPVPSGPAPSNVHKQKPMSHMKGLMQLVETIPLPGYDGFFDHLDYDIKTMHLFVTGEDDHLMALVDMKEGKLLKTTKVPGAPRKAIYVPATNMVWADLGSNIAVALDAATWEVVKTVELSGGKEADGRDCDNGAFDFKKGLFYVAARYRAAGKDFGAIDIVDTKTATLVGSIKMNGTEPAGLSLEPSGKILYAAMADVDDKGVSTVEVIDMDQRKVIASWPVTGAPNPHISGLDATHHRLFIGSRRGGGHNVDKTVLAVMNTETGKVVQVLEGPGGVDEVFYDEPSKRIILAGTTGTLAVYHQDDPDHYTLLGYVPTGPVAKSGIWIPELKRYYAAAPKFESRPTTSAMGHQNTKEWVTVEGRLMVFEPIP
jgi:hypothetical protein